MESARRVLAPSESERATAARLLTALASANSRGVSGPLTDAGWPTESAREEAPGAGAGPQVLEASASDAVGDAWTAPDAIAPPGASELSGDPRTASTRLVPSDPAEPERVPLSDEDWAVLNAFRTGPLRRTTDVLVSDARPSERSAEAHSDADLNDISEEMQALFVFEAGEDLREMQQALTAFEQQPTDYPSLAAALRRAHKLKGAAATLGFEVLGQMTHLYEEQLRALQSQQVPADATSAQLVMRGLAELHQALATIAVGQKEDVENGARMTALTAELLARAPEAPSAAITAPSSAVQSRAISTPLQRDRDGSLTTSSPDWDTSTLPTMMRLGAGEGLLRVDIRRMDELMSHVSALAINRAELAQVRRLAVDAQTEMEQALARLAGFSERLADLRLTTPMEAAEPEPDAAPTHLMARLLRSGRRTGVSSARAPAAETTTSAPLWDHLELERYSQYDELTRALAEAIGDLGACAATLRSVLRRMESLSQTQDGLTSAIQHAVTQVRLVPLSEQIPLLQRMVKVLAADLGKSVSFSVRGETTEIDRDVSEALAAALAQLVRNAVAHGIEPPDERQELGKPPEGHIWLHAYYTGNEANIQVGDDGRGINPDQIVAAALLAGVIDEETAAALSPEDALSLIFEQGVTTVMQATAVAGHGIGGAEVAQALARLRGTIHVRSTPGQGTIFGIRVPISLSMVRALHVRANGQGYAIPFTSVLQSTRVPAALRQEGADGQTVDPGKPRHVTIALGEREVEMPVFALSELLGLPVQPTPHETALVVELGRQLAAIVVDAVLADGELVVRSLPAHLRRRAVRGASVSPEGEVLLLLDLPELVGPALRLRRVAPQRIMPSPRPTPVPRPHILVVDDSLTIRRAVEHMLTREGYEVQTARDGMEALHLMLTDLPSLVILDIEMPRLDGFELLTVLRAHPEFAGVRVIMLTSRGAEKHRRYALSLGAHAYLVKPAPDDELMSTVRDLLASS